LNLKNIATFLRGHNCEKMVERIGNEVSLNVPDIDAGIAKINLGQFSNKVVELSRASNVATALDNSQYLICKMRATTSDYDLKINCDKIYLQLVLALTQLESIFETLKIEPSAKVRKELTDWIKYCSSLNRYAIETISPGTSGKGPEDYKIEDIMKYQNITEKDIEQALKES
jgi:hypothetical protein